MNEAGLIGCPDTRRINPANLLYFPCEATETRIMAGALQRLLRQEGTRSIVWLHDGMYVNSKFGVNTTKKAIIEAAEEVGIHGVKLRLHHVVTNTSATERTHRRERPSTRR